MRTVRGIPECSLPNGRRFTATVTYTCDDGDTPYVETAFVDIGPGRIDVLLRPHVVLTTVFQIRVTTDGRQMFPQIRAWFSMMRGRPIAVLQNEVSIQGNCMNVRIFGYFDARFQIRFNESEIAEATGQFASRDETTCATADGPLKNR